MKYNVILLFFICLQISHSQTSSSFEIGINALSTTKGFLTSPTFGIKLKKIKIQVGIPIGKEYVSSNLIIGGQADILYFPNDENLKKFNLFLLSSLNYFRSRQSVNFSKVSTNVIQSTYGYGFNYNISNNIFLKTSMSIGVLLENRNFNFESKDPTNKWGVAGIISFGLGYKL